MPFTRKSADTLRAELLVQPIIGQLVGHVVGPAHMRDYISPYSVTRRVETRRVSHTRVRPDKLDILVEYRQVVHVEDRRIVIFVSDRRVKQT